MDSPSRNRSPSPEKRKDSGEKIRLYIVAGTVTVILRVVLKFIHMSFLQDLQRTSPVQRQKGPSRPTQPREVPKRGRPLRAALQAAVPPRAPPPAAQTTAAAVMRMSIMEH